MRGFAKPINMISTAQRQELRGRAHALNPVVMIGDKGLADTVMAEIDRALKVHELIKIRVLSDEREDRSAAMALICKTLNCEAVQIIGKLLVVYRQRTEEETAQRARQQADRSKRARIRTAAKERESAPATTARTGATSRAARPARDSMLNIPNSKSPYPRAPRENAQKNRGVNSRVTRGSIDGNAVRAERAPRPTTRTATPGTVARTQARAPARTALGAPARAPSTRSSRPPRKSGY
jgi:RNA-binding protein